MAWRRTCQAIQPSEHRQVRPGLSEALINRLLPPSLLSEAPCLTPGSLCWLTVQDGLAVDA